MATPSVGPLLLLGALAYAAALLAARRRGRSWPGGRAACWYTGLAAAAVPTGMDFVSHMAGHLLLGMVAPMLLVLGAPGTLALRALPVRAARRLSRLLATRLVRVLAHPITAASSTVAACGAHVLRRRRGGPRAGRHLLLAVVRPGPFRVGARRTPRPWRLAAPAPFTGAKTTGVVR